MGDIANGSVWATAPAATHSKEPESTLHGKNDHHMGPPRP